ncbi:ribosome biogenesis GTPase YlqF [Caviibacter abscessus]|uniref:ribosome biogenesis GTPase YlqF n=1 Tax=Caviibacter abscessus TaxID=1766719 RepID=UPI00082D7460|nr:ribosome biogenesis GTPase YlqF [Caviibacter abscessus]
MELEKTNINWYPGHMKKAMDMLEEQLKLVDIVIEILDARIPISSKNPVLSKLAKNKKKIILLNKMDLVDKTKYNLWENYFLENNLADIVIPISVENGNNLKELKNKVDKLYDEKLNKMKSKGLRKTQIRAMVVGIPNVGKSKFINRFSSKSKAGVGNLPGFTRGKQWITVNEKFSLLDTPGVLWPRFDSHEIALNLAITGSIKDNILPLEEVCIELINKMREYNLIENIFKVYNIEVSDIKNIDNYELLSIVENRLKIHNTKEHNYELISRKILKDYRSGKLGKFFLELPRKENE